jgi:hypothetical protein
VLRTQLYLTPEERQGLSALSRATGRKRSELVREAVDRLIASSRRERRQEVLTRAAGLWSRRRDLPDFRQLRRA